LRIRLGKFLVRECCPPSPKSSLLCRVKLCLTMPYHMNSPASGHLDCPAETISQELEGLTCSWHAPRFSRRVHHIPGWAKRAPAPTRNRPRRLALLSIDLNLNWFTDRPSNVRIPGLSCKLALVNLNNTMLSLTLACGNYSTSREQCLCWRSHEGIPLPTADESGVW
jgi:hypothetical protein